MDSTLSPAIANIVGIVATAGGLALIWLLIKASSWVSEKIKSVKASYETFRDDASFNAFINTKCVVMDVIQDVVDALNQTLKKELIENSEDGKLSKEDGKRLLNKAIELIMSEISESQQEILETGFGDLEEWIRTKIENSVEKSKANVVKNNTADSTEDTVESVISDYDL